MATRNFQATYVSYCRTNPEKCRTISQRQSSSSCKDHQDPDVVHGLPGTRGIGSNSVFLPRPSQSILPVNACVTVVYKPSGSERLQERSRLSDFDSSTWPLAYIIVAVIVYLVSMVRWFPEPKLLTSITRPPSPVSRRLLASLRSLWSGQDLPHHSIYVVACIFGLLPLLGVTKTDFLKSDAILPVRPADMKMARYHDLGVVADMPVLSELCSAPQAESWDQGDVNQVLAKWPVVDDYKGNASGCSSLELDCRLLDKMVTPFVSRRIRIRVQQVLIGGVDALFECPFQAFLACHIRGTEGIIVECEDGADQSTLLLAIGIDIVPRGEFVLRSEHAPLFGSKDTGHVFALASQVHFVLCSTAGGIELVITRYPVDLLEVPGRNVEYLIELAHCLTDYE
jgi:hypothetical protein